MRLLKGRHLPVPSKRFLFVTWVIAIVITLAIGVAGLTALIGQSQRIDDLTTSRDNGKRDRADLRQDLTQQREANTALSDQVQSLGQKPVVESGKTNQAGQLPTLIRGLQGPRGPTGKTGKIGKVGPGPSIDLMRQLVNTAIVASCPPSGICKGAPGKSITGPRGKSVKGDTGPGGKDGKNGESVKGERGPGPTDQQVADAVTAYCDAHNQCRGSTGPRGRPGADAPPLIPPLIP